MAWNAFRAVACAAALDGWLCSGGVLLSRAVPRAVPSALKGLTSGFGMGPGVSPSLGPPRLYGDVFPALLAAPGRPHLGNRTVDAKQALPAQGDDPLEPSQVSRSQATRPISTGQLHTLPCFHLRPI